MQAGGPLGIYLHIPFCQARCTYCAFYTVAHDEGRKSHFVASLVREIEAVARRGPGGGLPAAGGRHVDTIYLGGGTPSLLAAREMGRLLGTIDECFDVAGDAEVTLEANPETVSPAAARGWRHAGVNRVSLGAQSFRQDTLARLGRLHSPQIIKMAAATLRQAEFDNLGLDLIAGVNTDSFAADLEAALSLAPDHLSVYLLEVDEEEVGGRTMLARQAALGRALVPDEGWYAASYAVTVKRLAAAGLQRYEICNFARSGKACRHNLKYWRCREVLGLGPASHSLYAGTRYRIEADLDGYMAAVSAGGRPSVRLDAVDTDGRAAELAFMGLRLDEGVDLEDVRRRTGVPLARRRERQLASLVQAGLLQRSGERLRLSSRGILLSNEVFQQFLP